MVYKVLMVCLGNICRSPTAEAVLRERALQMGFGRALEVDSAGTGDWHLGHPADARSQRTAAAKGYDLSRCRSRLVNQSDFDYFDQILAMDRRNLADLQAQASFAYQNKIALLRSYSLPCASENGVEDSLRIDDLDVPDPYAGGPEGFDRVLQLIEDAVDGFLQHLVQHSRLSK